MTTTKKAMREVEWAKIMWPKHMHNRQAYIAEPVLWILSNMHKHLSERNQCALRAHRYMWLYLEGDGKETHESQTLTCIQPCQSIFINWQKIIYSWSLNGFWLCIRIVTRTNSMHAAYNISIRRLYKRNLIFYI